MTLGVWPGQALVGLSEEKREATVTDVKLLPLAPGRRVRLSCPRPWGTLSLSVFYTRKLSCPAMKKPNWFHLSDQKAWLSESLFLGVEETH